MNTSSCTTKSRLAQTFAVSSMIQNHNRLPFVFVTIVAHCYHWKQRSRSVLFSKILGALRLRTVPKLSLSVWKPSWRKRLNLREASYLFVACIGEKEQPMKKIDFYDNCLLRTREWPGSALRWSYLIAKTNLCRWDFFLPGHRKEKPISGTPCYFYYFPG